VAIRELGYLIFGGRDIDGWRRLGTEVIGQAASDIEGGGLYLKMDTRDFRIAVVPDSEDRLIAAGLETANKGEYEVLRNKLEADGVEVRAGTEAEKKLRRVHDFFWVRDPAGNRVEIYWGYISNFVDFRSPIGVKAFITEGLGLGHVVLPTDDIEATQDFWVGKLGFGLSDILSMNFGGMDVKLYFNHCDNGRQHSVALAKLPSPNGCVHFMVEMPTLKDVGLALDRVQDAGLKLVMTLGQHVNDDCVSFYFRSPAGFMIEIGWEGVIKNWTRHSVFETTLPSLWGHRFVEHLNS
jgi:3,4-dihydroxy-9,10-secoandrosta-1,3,5(10)-triene-9,17-dione 4,5-dioxygenase